jgi:hypothetical protein
VCGQNNALDNNWYVAKLIIQCKVEGEDTGPWTIDEQVRVLRAPDPNTAHMKAMALGKQQETSYENMYGKLVSWEFVGLGDLEQLFDDSIVDGTEITSRLLTTSSPSGLISSKDNLQVNWIERNRYRKAEDILRQRDLIE